jgi:UDP-2,3-diacylglucosamine hydrolase
LRLGHVVSDLHLYAQRSVAARHLDALDAAAGRSAFFVLNGDIFDFRWSRLGSLGAAMEAGVVWLEELCRRHPACRFHYVLGNHDAVEPFVRMLREAMPGIPNLALHESILKVGDALFLHGDTALHPQAGLGPSSRRLKPTDRVKGRTLSVLYRAVCASHLHRAVAAVASPRRSARTILHALHREGGPWLGGVTDIYFGHTHVPFNNLDVGGYRFHNTGSAIVGMRWNMLAVHARDVAPGDRRQRRRMNQRMGHAQG